MTASCAETALCVFDQVKDLIPALERAAAANKHFFDRVEDKSLYEGSAL